MSELAPCDVERTLSDLDRALAGPRTAGAVLPSDVVEAIDVVHHALEFTGEPRGLALWREALYDSKIGPDARTAVRVMLVYLNDAVLRGEDDRVSEICDCLDHVMRPKCTAEP
jgi:hypothetical protein